MQCPLFGTKKQKLEREVASHTEPGPLICRDLVEVYRRKITDLNIALIDKDTAPEAFELIRSLIADITLTLENGQLGIDIHGELAGMLNLCSESKKPATRLGDGLEQIKMVAGPVTKQNII